MSLTQSQESEWFKGEIINKQILYNSGIICFKTLLSRIFLLFLINEEILLEGKKLCIYNKEDILLMRKANQDKSIQSCSISAKEILLEDPIAVLHNKAEKTILSDNNCLKTL